MTTLTSRLVLALVDRVTRPAKAIARSLTDIDGAIDRANGRRGGLLGASAANGRALARVRGQMTGVIGMAVATGYALGAPIRAASEFEGQLTDIGQKADLTGPKLAALRRQIVRLGRATNLSNKQAAEGVDAIAAAGLDPQVGVRMLAPMGRVVTAYKAEMADVANAGVAMVQNLKLPIGDVAKAFDIAAQAGKEGKFELKDMATYLPSLAASAQAFGQTGTAAVADITAALQVMRMKTGDASSAATNMENVFAKMRSPQTIRAFAKEGVDLMAQLAIKAKEGKTPLEALAEVTNQTLKGDLSRLPFLFQDMQAQQGLRALIQEMDTYRRIRDKAGSAKGVVDADFLERMKTAEARQARWNNTLDRTKTAIGAGLIPMLNAVMDVTAPFLELIGSLAERFPGVTRVVLGAAAAVVVFRVATLAGRFAALEFRQAGLDLALGMIGLKGKLLGVAGFIAGPFVRAHQLGRVQARLMAMEMRAASASGMAGRTGLIGWAQGLLAMLNPLRMVRAGLGLTKLAFRGLLIGSGIGLLVLAAGWIIEHWRGVVTFFQGFGKGFMAAIAPVRPALEPLIAVFRTVAGWISKLIGDGSGDDWTKWGVAVGAAIGGLVTKVAQFVGWIAKAVGWFGRLFGGAAAPGPGGAAGGAPGGPPRPPKRAGGGHVRAGGIYQVNEKGQELFAPGRSGTILPNRELGKVGGSRSVTARIQFGDVIVHGAGADPDTVADRVMARLGRELEAAANALFADAALRGA